MSENEAIKIAKLNDQLRTTFKGGSVCMTAGIVALEEALRLRVFAEVCRFNDFTADNDPYGEHDCGLVEVDGVSVIWKIDYYDPTFSVHSDDPSDASLTGRVLTIMLAEEM
jgi:hypothetical protein